MKRKNGKWGPSLLLKPSNLKIFLTPLVKIFLNPVRSKIGTSNLKQVAGVHFFRQRRGSKKLKLICWHLRRKCWKDCGAEIQIGENSENREVPRTRSLNWWGPKFSSWTGQLNISKKAFGNDEQTATVTKFFIDTMERQESKLKSKTADESSNVTKKNSAET